VIGVAAEATPGATELSVAVKLSVKGEPTLVVGVPVRTPAALRLNPAGRPVAVHV
jgi:hypothetical protein